MMVGAVERTARPRRSQPLERLLMADVHPERHLRLAAVAPEVALADQEAEEKAHAQIALVSCPSTTYGLARGSRSHHECNLMPRAVSPSSFVRNNALASEGRLKEFSTGRRCGIASSTRRKRS
jgi:hypothetical protein